MHRLNGEYELDWNKDAHRILNALDKPVLVIDRAYHIIAANNAAIRTFCLSLNDIIGKECFKVTHKTEIPCWSTGMECPVKLAFETRERTKVINQHMYAGRTVIEEVTAVPMIDDHGDIDYVVEELNDVTELVHSKEIAEHLKNELKILRGIIPICASCKKVRDDAGYWQQIESYLSSRSNAEFSHAICPECFKKLYPEIAKK
jgi:PAS domain S-box-containing protein